MVIYYIKYIFKLLHISDLITYSLHNFSGKQSRAFPENVSFFSLRIQNTFEIDKSVKMPKFKKQCNNPFQEKWSGREGCQSSESRFSCSFSCFSAIRPGRTRGKILLWNTKSLHYVFEEMLHQTQI